MISVSEVVLWIVYFVSLYFTVFWLIVFLENEGNMQRDKRGIVKRPSVSIVIPAYNEEKSIRKTIDSCLSIDYPADKIEIIVINDGSKDRTRGVVESAIAENTTGKPVRLINQRNIGKAASMNKAIRMAKGEFFVCLDADSYVDREALEQLLQEFEDDKVAVALPLMKSAEPRNLLQRMQYIEYLINIFFKKVMGFLDCIHVAPGPFSVYRKSALLEIGGYDENSITEDLEIAVRLQKRGYRIVQNMEALVYTNTPANLREYYSQRNRWFKGGLLTAIKHRDMFFNPAYGDFGLIQFPILIISGVLSLALLSSAAYYFLKPYVDYSLRMGLVRYDFLTYLRTMKFSINLFNIDVASLAVFMVTVSLSIYVLHLSYKFTKDKIDRKHFYVIPIYMFFYFFVTGLAWVGVIKDILLKKKSKW